MERLSAAIASCYLPAHILSSFASSCQLLCLRLAYSPFLYRYLYTMRAIQRISSSMCFLLTS